MAGMNQIVVYVNDDDFKAINDHAAETGDDYASIMVDGAKRSMKDHKADAAAKKKAEKEKADKQAQREKAAADAEKNANTPVEGAAQPL